MLRSMLLRCLSIGSLIGLGTALAADRDQRTEIPAAATRAVSFSKDVRPLLTARCGSCHMNGKKSGGFRMDNRDLFLKGGDSGPALEIGKSSDSRLIKLVAALEADNRMPPEGPILSNEHVGILRAWIDQGLKWEEGTATKAPEQLTAAEAEAAGLCAVRKVPSKLVYHTTLGDKKFHFCCPQCKQQFLANPVQYGVPAAEVVARRPVQPAAPATVARLEAAALARVIDDHIHRRLTESRIAPSPPADDAEFLRRLYLDLHGVIPPPDKVVAFLSNADASKRAKVIEELLADPRYGRRLADVWDHLLVPHNTPGCEPAVVPLTQYLETKFNANRPWDELVRDLLTATGPQQDHGAVTYFLANHTTPTVVDATSRVFLGVRLECAQCHDHPYTAWEQRDYWGLASFFTGVSRSDIDRKTGILVIKPGSSSVTEKSAALQAGPPPPAPVGRVKSKEKPLLFPARFLGAEPFKPASSEPILARPHLARWLTAPENPFFARAMVNRVWWHFFGRGLVHPVDDMFKPEATATHPELLETLTAQFVASGYDLKHLTRAIVSSQAYQRTSKPSLGSQNDQQLYSRMPIKVLTPEQLWDSLVNLFGSEPAMPPARIGRVMLALQNGVPTTPRGEFVRYFLGETNASPTDFTQGIPHALRLLNGMQFNNVEEALARLTRADDDPARAVEALYLATLSRRPSSAESTFMTEYIQRRGKGPAAQADILWALLKSSEFVMNH